MALMYGLKLVPLKRKPDTVNCPNLTQETEGGNLGEITKNPPLVSCEESGGVQFHLREAPR